MRNIHLIVYQHEGGFFSNFNKLIVYLATCKDNVVKITWNTQGQPYGAFAYNCSEVFGQLFNVYEDTSYEIDNIEHLHIYNNTEFTGKEVHTKYVEDTNWRQLLHKQLKYITYKSFLEQSITLAVDSSFLKNYNVVGILKRNELLKCEQFKGQMPTMSDYFNILDPLVNDNTMFYLSVDNEQDLYEFKQRYNRSISNRFMKRTNVCTDVEPHFTPGTIFDAANTYIEICCLAKSNIFVHPLSNMATAVLYHNPNTKSIYLQ